MNNLMESLEKTYFTLDQLKEIEQRIGIDSFLFIGGSEPIDITSCISKCQHISLLPGFSLFLYSRVFGHGTYGVIGAVRQGEPRQGIKASFAKDNQIHDCFREYGIDFAVDPYEVIQSDGTAEGLLEAFFLWKYFKKCRLSRINLPKVEIIDHFPYDDDPVIKWNIIDYVSDFRPCIIKANSILEFRLFTRITQAERGFIVGDPNFHSKIVRTAVQFQECRQTDYSYPATLEHYGDKTPDYPDLTCKNQVDITVAYTDVYSTGRFVKRRCPKCFHQFNPQYGSCAYCGTSFPKEMIFDSEGVYLDTAMKYYTNLLNTIKEQVMSEYDPIAARVEKYQKDHYRSNSHDFDSD